MPLQILVAPAAEPVTLAEAKVHLRVDHTDEDALISALVSAAREHVERFTSRTLIYTGYRLTLNQFPNDQIELPRSPVVRANANTVFAYATPRVTYTDPSGATQTLVEDSDYLLDLANNPPRIARMPFGIWPVSQYDRVNAVTVDFVSGYGSNGAPTPNLLRQAILLMVGHWYEHREAVGQFGNEVPLAVDSILRIWSDGGYR